MTAIGVTEYDPRLTDADSGQRTSLVGVGSLRLALALGDTGLWMYNSVDGKGPSGQASTRGPTDTNG
ncbi:hypothetical protein [Kitasatospora sp. HPMI-4]|uniref:hypothetical protein n=1 Tax=Kitasatospora sp. HPMI-4 TaxID=3448443 RepID=UPI003F1C3F54